MDAQGNGLAGGLLAGDTLNVNYVLETVDGGDLALLVLVAATDNCDLVVLADGDAADLLLQNLSTSKPIGKESKSAREVYFDIRCTSHEAPC